MDNIIFKVENIRSKVDNIKFKVEIIPAEVENIQKVDNISG